MLSGSPMLADAESGGVEFTTTVTDHPERPTGVDLGDSYRVGDR